MNAETSARFSMLVTVNDLIALGVLRKRGLSLFEGPVHPPIRGRAAGIRPVCPRALYRRTAALRQKRPVSLACFWSRPGRRARGGGSRELDEDAQRRRSRYLRDGLSRRIRVVHLRARRPCRARSQRDAYLHHTPGKGDTVPPQSVSVPRSLKLGMHNKPCRSRTCAATSKCLAPHFRNWALSRHQVFAKVRFAPAADISAWRVTLPRRFFNGYALQKFLDPIKRGVPRRRPLGLDPHENRRRLSRRRETHPERM